MSRFLAACAIVALVAAAVEPCGGWGRALAKPAHHECCPENRAATTPDPVGHHHPAPPVPDRDDCCFTAGDSRAAAPATLLTAAATPAQWSRVPLPGAFAEGPDAGPGAGPPGRPSSAFEHLRSTVLLI
jgi:hypothetical protein